MDHGTLALLIPIVALSIPIVRIWTKHRREIASIEAEAGARGGSSADAARIAELEDRVRVLERIVTDPGYDVASQIEALRQPRVDAASIGLREKV